MVLTSNHILIIKTLFSSRKEHSRASLLKLGLTPKEFDKEAQELIDDGVIKKTSKGYRLQFHTHGTREYLQVIYDREISQQKNHYLWTKEISKLSREAHAALFYYEKKIHLLIICKEGKKQLVSKDVEDFKLFTKQIIDPLLLTTKEFLEALDKEDHKVHQWLAKGTVAFGLSDLCQLLS